MYYHEIFTLSECFLFVQKFYMAHKLLKRCMQIDEMHPLPPPTQVSEAWYEVWF